MAMAMAMAITTLIMMIGGNNTWASGVVRYSAGVVDWTMEEMASMDRRTRKVRGRKGQEV